MRETNDIPEELFNSDTQAPFDRCTICDCSLSDPSVDYSIQKAIRKVPKLQLTEVIFEYAICQTCALEERDKMSTESLSSIENYLKESTRDRRSVYDISFDSCLVTGKEISACNEYSLFAQCVGGQITDGTFPYAISDLAMDQIGELLSAETIDELDDFTKKHFSGPPEYAELLNPHRFVPL